MIKRIFITIVPLFVYLLNFVAVPPVTRAYTVASNFFTNACTKGNNSGELSFSQNGVLILQSFFELETSIESFDVDQRHLDRTWISGTWQGSPTSELNDPYLYELGDSVSIITTALVPESVDYFLYSVTTILPFTAGDKFRLNFRAHSESKDYSNYYCNYSILYGVSGVNRVYLDKHYFSNSPGSPQFELTSDNQFIAFLSSTSVFSDSMTSVSQSTSSKLVSSSSNLTHLASNKYFSAYTSNYGLNSGDTISLTLNDNIDEWNFQVFELVTDGSFYPGSFDDDNYSGGSGGSGGSSTDITPIIDRLDTIIDKLDSGSVAFSPEDYWAVYREGLIELFGLEDSQVENPEPTEPPPEDTTDDSLDSALGSGIDKEQFDKAFDYVETDLGTNISGSTGAISFFWYITDKFLSTTGLYTVVGLSLIFALATWLLRS